MTADPRIARTIIFVSATICCTMTCVDHLESRISKAPASAMDRIPAELLETISEPHRRLLGQLARNIDELGPMPEVSVCWSSSPDDDMATALTRLMEGADNGAPGHKGDGTNWFQFNDNDRWSTTATDGGGLTQGQPTHLTWGIVPDGTTVDGASSVLINVLDNSYGIGPGGSDLTQRPWFTLFEQVFDRWAEVSGLRYVYEPNDDGASFPGSPGILGVRPDVRIGSISIDGSSGSNIYGYNYFPNLGDMVLDRDNQGGISNATNNSIWLRNLVAHEAGHGIGLNHSCPEDVTKLMEPTHRTSFDGPQIDDIVGANRGYGDADEYPTGNDTHTTATYLGAPGINDVVVRLNRSIDNLADTDWFSFTAPQGLRVTITVQPTGSITWDSSGGIGACPFGPDVDTRENNDLGLALYGLSGTNLLKSSVQPIGVAEVIADWKLLDGTGTYHVKVSGANNLPQTYDLTLAFDPGTPPVAQCRDAFNCTPTLGTFRLNNGSYDPDGDPITFSMDPPPPYSPGVHFINLIVADEILADTCVSEVTINSPPDGSCQAVTVEGDSTCTAVVTPQDLDDGTSDVDGHAVTLSVEPPGPYGEGVHQVLFIATDACSAADTCTTTVTVTCPGQLAADVPGVVRFGLSRVAPNPMRSRTVITYGLEDPGSVQATVYDATGRRIRTLVDGFESAGEHVITWDGRTERGGRAVAGLYFIELATAHGRDIRKVVLVP